MMASYFPPQQQPESSFKFDSNMDQFEAFFARSKQQEQQYGGGAPEVNIEVPSDSDSSRRPSKYTLSNASSVQDIYAEMQVTSQAEKGANNRPRTQFQQPTSTSSSRRVSQQQSGKIKRLLKRPISINSMLRMERLPPLKEPSFTGNLIREQFYGFLQKKISSQ